MSIKSLRVCHPNKTRKENTPPGANGSERPPIVHRGIFKDDPIINTSVTENQATLCFGPLMALVPACQAKEIEPASRTSHSLQLGPLNPWCIRIQNVPFFRVFIFDFPYFYSSY